MRKLLKSEMNVMPEKMDFNHHNEHETTTLDNLTKQSKRCIEHTTVGWQPVGDDAHG